MKEGKGGAGIVFEVAVDEDWESFDSVCGNFDHMVMVCCHDGMQFIYNLFLFDFDQFCLLQCFRQVMVRT
jgi:hypothetical protein